MAKNTCPLCNSTQVIDAFVDQTIKAYQCKGCNFKSSKSFWKYLKNSQSITLKTHKLLPQLAEACQTAMDCWMMGEDFNECTEEYDEATRLIRELKKCL